MITGGRAAVVEAVANALGTEAAEDDGVNRADARAAEHGDGSLGDHRHVDDDAVALCNAVGEKRVGEAADFGVELAVGESADVAGLALPDDGGLVGPGAVEVAIEAVLADVALRADEPLREGAAAPVEDFGPGFAPGELGGFAGPEGGRVGDGFLVELAVFVEGADVGPLGEVGRRIEDALLVEVGFDIVAHAGVRVIEAASLARPNFPAQWKL